MSSSGSSRSETPSRYARRADPDLIAACLSGDTMAWKALIQRYEALIYSIPVRLGVSQADAGDLFQDVCLLLYHHLEDLRDTQRLSTWLITTTKREVWRWQRRKRVTLASEMPEQEWKLEGAEEVTGVQTAPAPDELVLALEEQQLVRRAMEQLPERCRELLTRLYLQDPPATYAEVASDLGLPLNGISPTRARCLQRLQKILEEIGF